MSNAFDEVDFDYATVIADRVNRLMSQHRVPPTPNNFSVWFSYATGASPALRKTIDILVANKRKFDAATNRDLYATYINPLADGDDVPEQLQAVISSAKQFLATAISDNRTQIEALGEASSECQAVGDPRRSSKGLSRNCQMRRSGPRPWRRISSRPRGSWTRFETR